MLIEDKASVEAVLDERDPSRLRIDIQVHPTAGRSFGSDAGEIQRAIREGFRDALREAQLDRLMLASNPQPKRRGWLGRVLGFFACVGLGAVATIALSAYHPRPSASAGLEDLGSPLATPGSQSSELPGPSAAVQPQSRASAGAAEAGPGPGTFGLHQQ
jgi:hypothetical protein